MELGLLASLGASSLAGACAGFGAGLVPGLHMNNIAAGVTAYAGLVLGAFAALGETLQAGSAALLVSCFVSAALTAHLFAGSITSTYLGIPAGDVLSVLPAHRLARAGLGSIAVRASADGCLAGFIGSVFVLLPMCLLMGPPVGFYSFLKSIMGYILILFSAVLLLSEGVPLNRLNHFTRRHLTSTLKALVLFLSSGILGLVVLATDFNASPVPDVPWVSTAYVQKSSLLLPLFAGLYGIPSLLLSLGSRVTFDLKNPQLVSGDFKPDTKDRLISLLGGTLVGWMPGMTSGSSAALCAPSVKEGVDENNLARSSRFIWLYSSITASGAVFAVGALFVILRARSGSMDAVQFFLNDAIVPGSLDDDMLPMVSILLSMLTAACICHWILEYLEPNLFRLHGVLCSRKVAIMSLTFVCILSLALTGVRGGLVMATSTCLGLLSPLVGVRRIQLMGCLLVPITIAFFTNT